MDNQASGRAYRGAGAGGYLIISQPGVWSAGGRLNAQLSLSALSASSAFFTMTLRDGIVAAICRNCNCDCSCHATAVSPNITRTKHD